MAHELGLKIIAEGIENQNQFDYLRQQRVQYGQGRVLPGTAGIE